MKPKNIKPLSAPEGTKHFLLTVDVEDWFQVENFKSWIPFETWDQRELRVERNVHRLLNLFDSIELKAESSKLKAGDAESSKLKAQSREVNEPHKPHQRCQLNQPCNPIEQGELHNNENLSHEIYDNENEADFIGTNNPHLQASNPQPTTNNIQTKKVHATFFVLGWLAERLPHLVREIQSRGHEVASHGCNHELPNSLSPKALKTDLIDSKKLLEDIIGEAVTGYRAPSFAINDDILKAIGECGYRYDSSYNSFSLHGRYGQISLNGAGKKGIARRIAAYFYELPISNLKLVGQTLPWGGGGYFRLLPVSIFNSGVKTILRHQDAYMFYAHPWEFDPAQPKLKQASFSFKFRHYNNLNKTELRLKSLITSFNHCRFVTCREYLNSVQSDRPLK